MTEPTRTAGQQRFMDIRIVFEKVTDDCDPEYTYFEPTESFQLASNIPHGDLYGVAETWAQSDHYQLLSTNVILDALSDDRTDLTR